MKKHTYPISNIPRSKYWMNIKTSIYISTEKGLFQKNQLRTAVGKELFSSTRLILHGITYEKIITEALTTECTYVYVSLCALSVSAARLRLVDWIVSSLRFADARLRLVAISSNKNANANLCPGSKKETS